MSITLRQTAEGILLPVKAQAGAKRNAVTGVHDGQLKVSVTQAPEKGKANKAILQLLADALKISPGQMQLASGETSPRKQVLVSGLTLDELHGKLQELVAALPS